MKPVTFDTGVVFALLRYAAANADEGPDGLGIDCTGILDGYDHSAGRVRVAPHSVAADSDKAVMELVRTVVHKAHIADDDTAGAVNVDEANGFDGKSGKPIAVECGVHPVFFRDEQHAVAGMYNTGGHRRSVNVLDDAGC